MTRYGRTKTVATQRNVEIVRRAMERIAWLRRVLEERQRGADRPDEVQTCFQILSVESTRSMTLSTLLDDLGRVKDVPRDRIPALLLQLVALQTALAARLEELTARRDVVEPKDRLLKPEEAAELLGVDPLWLRRNWRRYQTSARRVSRKNLRFSEASLRRWIATRVPS